MDPLLTTGLTGLPGLSGYVPSPQCFDEAVDANGVVRPAWRNLVATLGRLGGQEVEQRRRLADRLLAAQGASHLYHDDDDLSRPWQLDPVPLVLSRAEWTPLAEGIGQRALLLDAVLRDLYGPRHLLREGVIPAEAVLGSPAYQWPVLGTYDNAARDAGQTHGARLIVYGADLVRTSAGDWRVLRDLTDAPPGAGYALLNRTVITRLFPDDYRELGVVRLDEFFATLRRSLAALSPPGQPAARTVVLTSGLGHPSYFEHSYLAEHLGYNLAEGGDLTVRDGRVWLRSLGGLEPVDVLLRRIDDHEADPLELERGEGRGVPGLLHVSRLGNVGLANGLGSRVGGSFSLQPYLAAASRRLLGQTLLLPSLTTLWCGDPDQRAEVERRLRSMVIHENGSATEHSSLFGDELTDEETAVLLRRMAEQPSRFVGQEKVHFATTPLLRSAAVVPGTIVLRVQAVIGPTGVSVLPGGLGRVLDPGVPVVTQRSGLAKDVWIVDGEHGGRRRERVSAEPAMAQVDLRSSLPTRSAEALFWIGRNSERAEALARLVRAVLARMAQDPDLVEADAGWVSWATAGLWAARGLTGRPAPDDGRAPAERLAGELGDAVGGLGGLSDRLEALQRGASSVRAFMSTTVWQVLSPVRLEAVAELESLDQVVISLSALSGLALESTVRGPSWRMLDLGRRLERSFVVLGAVESMLAPRPEPDAAGARYEVVLQANESLVAYRRRYRSDTQLEAVLDLLVTDDSNPRSLAFQLDRITEHLAALPGAAARRTLEGLVEHAARIVLQAAWQVPQSRVGGPAPTDRSMIVDQLVLDTRGPMLEMTAAFISQWFADPAVVRRMGPTR